MKKITLGLATAGAFAALTVGLATPAMAATATSTPAHAAVYVADDHTATYQPVDCHVHVIYQGNPVDVAWC